jgi:hypothetical protein
MDMATVRTVDVLMPDAEMQAAVESRLVEKARLITEAGPTGPVGDPPESWHCRYCSHAGRCPFRITQHPPQAG